jgi:hypothetical protein
LTVAPAWTTGTTSVPASAPPAASAEIFGI